MTTTIKPADYDELRFWVFKRIETHGPQCDLNDIDVSDIDNFSYLFEGTTFNGDVSQWDMRNAENMDRMFASSHFNGDLSKWNVSNVKSMQSMFAKSPFQGDVSQWDVRNSSTVYAMFLECPFDGDLSSWQLPLDANILGVGRFMDFVANSVPAHRNNLRLPELPIEGFRLFLSRKTHQHWLHARANANDIGRYHWDALLENAKDCPWATPEMLTLTQTYLALNTVDPKDIPSHAAVVQQMWRAQPINPIELPFFEM